MHGRQFFELLFSSLAAVLAEAFERVGKQAAIEQELGRLLRCAARAACMLHPSYMLQHHRACCSGG